MRRARLAILILVPVAGASCAETGHGPNLGLAPSLLPNVGIAASLAVPFTAEGGGHAEVRFTDQFVDDKAFADDGNPEAGNWTQLDLGWMLLAPDEERSWSVRAGVTGFRARGEPNLAEEPGDYIGIYIGVGHFAKLAPDWLFGPEFTVVIATGPDDRVIFPQITWGPRWSP